MKRATASLASLAVLSIASISSAESTFTDERFAGTLAFGAELGPGSPLGVLGASVEAKPVENVGVEVGFGTGGTFGPATAEMVRVGTPVTVGWYPFVGVALSQNFLNARFGRSPSHYGGAASTAHWLNLEVGSEWRLPSGWFVRLALGRSQLLNGGSYACGDELQGCASLTEHDRTFVDPSTASVDHQFGRTTALFYGYFALGYAFAL